MTDTSTELLTALSKELDLHHLLRHKPELCAQLIAHGIQPPTTFSGQITVNVDNLRRQLTNAVRRVQHHNTTVVQDEELAEKINDVIFHTNSLNCIYIKGVEHFNDMSELFIEVDDSEESDND